MTARLRLRAIALMMGMALAASTGVSVAATRPAQFIPTGTPAVAASIDRVLLTGTVIKVIDGDTIVVQIARKHVRVHLDGVDAPESGQPWAHEAAAALAQMVLNQQVDVQPIAGTHGSSLTAVVFVGEAEVGAAMVGDGQAWADRNDLRRRDTGLCEAEATARAERRGLWALPSNQRVAPWEYRRRFVHVHFTDYSAETAEHCMASARR